MNHINTVFEQLFEEYLTEDTHYVTLPLYCGGSVSEDTTAGTIASINLNYFSEWALEKERVLAPGQAKYFRDFIKEKIENGTLYTNDSMANVFSMSKRLQLFINSNIAEHAIVNTLGGKLLDGNDDLTTTSKAVIGEDGCALADVNISGIDVEVKVTHTDETRNIVLSKAHKKDVVAIYIINPSAGTHWEFYVRGNKGAYARTNFIVGHNYYDNVTGNRYDKDLTEYALLWQNTMIDKVKSLPLLHFKDEADESLRITPMIQK